MQPLYSYISKLLHDYSLLGEEVLHPLERCAYLLRMARSLKSR